MEASTAQSPRVPRLLLVRREGVRRPPLLRWLLAVPHLAVLFLLALPTAVAALLAGLSVTFSGRYPEAAFALVAGFLRWLGCLVAYLCLLSDEYPPFALYDRPSASARLKLELSPGHRIPRWRPLFGWLLVLPQLLAFTVATLFVVVATTVRSGDPLPRRRFQRIACLLEREAQVLAYALFLSRNHLSWRSAGGASPS